MKKEGRYLVAERKVYLARDIHSVYEMEFEKAYILIGYRYDAVKGICMYVLYPRKNQI